MAILLESPDEVAFRIVRQFRAKRLSLNLSQKSLAQRSGVSFSVLKHFEKTAKISLISLLKLALVLGALEEFTQLFNSVLSENYLSLDQILKENKTRKRGRQ